MSLCIKCQTISTVVVRSDEEEGTEVYTHTSTTFSQSVADNCYFCTRVDRDMPMDIRRDLLLADNPDFPGIRCCISENRSRYGLDFSIPGRQMIKFFVLGEYFDFGIPKFSSTTNHEYVWKRIKKWHNICKLTHTKCNTSLYPTSPNGPGKWLPTRLLDVTVSGGDMGTSEDIIRVVTTADLDQRPETTTDIQYLALSHCWGTKPFLNLTRQNQGILEDHFSIQQLPRNFRDAVQATRQLGFRYVWIDSLCIIQGDGGDWLHEAPLMDKVYMNAEFCLAASASDDAEGGLFRERDPDILRPYRIDLLLQSSPSPPPSPGAPHHLTDGLEQQDHLPQEEEKKEEEKPTLKAFYAYSEGTTPSMSWYSLVNQCPLNRRGWVQQERILAPRTVHFCQNQVCWECKEQQALETSPDWAIDEDRWDMIKNWETKWLVHPDGPGNNTNNNNESGSHPRAISNLYWAWYDIIGLYSDCQLSYEKDKLVAVSGMAKVLTARLNDGRGDEYVAGLWRSDLLQGLLWGRLLRDIGDPLRTARRPEGYRAPTWSWASLDGRVEWLLVKKSQSECAEVRSVHIEYRTPTAMTMTTSTVDPTMGDITYAELTLWCYLAPRPCATAADEGKGGLGTSFAGVIDVEGEDTGIPVECQLLVPLYNHFIANVWKHTFGLILTEVKQDRQGEGDNSHHVQAKKRYRRLGQFRVVSRATDEWYAAEGMREVIVI